MSTNFLEFFEPARPTVYNEPTLGLGSVIQFAFITTFTALSAYGMNYFAFAGMLGSLGMGIILFVSFAMLVVVNNYLPELRIRSFVLSTAILTLFFLYLIPVNMENSRPPNDATIQEILRTATAG